MDPEAITPSAALALGGQILLLLAGLAVLWRSEISPAGRVLRERPSPLTPWTAALPDFGMALLVVIAGGVAGQILAQLIVQALALSDDPSMLLQGTGFQGGLLAGAGMARLTVLRPRPRMLGEDDLDDTPPEIVPPPPAINVMAAAVATFLAAVPVLFVISLAWTFLVTELGFNTDKQPLVSLFAESDSPPLVLGMSFLAVVVAPLVEETIFRAGLFRYLRTRLPRWIALLLPALIFGSLHGNLVAFLPLVALGVVFALAYERTGRISVPIIAHALFNLNTILLLLSGVEV